MKANKTNAMRMLDSAKIKYEVLEYSLDKDLFSGEAVSDLLSTSASSRSRTNWISRNVQKRSASRTSRWST